MNLAPDPTDAMQKTGRACTDPIWLQDRFLADGHGRDTLNGTATFISLSNQYFIVTCEHVASVSDGRRIPALMINKTVLNMASYDQNGTYRHNFRFPDKEKIDIAIYQLTEFHWNLFVTKKSKIAINLDRYHEPKWSGEFSYAALGYPTEHKDDRDAEVTAAPMAFCVAELSSDIGPLKPTFTLHSAMAAPHGWHFSGMSGGPIFQIADDGELLPVGIIFEGGPSSANQDSIYAQPHELFFRGHVITPSIFQQWLTMAGY